MPMLVAELKKRKKNLKLTTEKLAYLADLPVSTVSKVMTGETKNPSFVTVEKIASAIEQEETRRRMETYLSSYKRLVKDYDEEPDLSGSGLVMVYPVIFTSINDEKDTYLIDIPDIHGMTEGYGLADSIGMARDYIGGFLYDKKDEDFPKASSIEEIDVKSSEFFGLGQSTVSLVDIDIDAYRREQDNRAVRRNVSLPNWLNQAADKAHINVSRVLQDALIKELEGTRMA